jgi:putative glutamine amidotransferase
MSNMMSFPLVAVTATTEIIRGALRTRLDAAYVEALEGAGLIPVAAAPLADPAAAGELLRRVDGLVLSGGEDIDPARYGALRHPASQQPSGARDSWELALVGAAREQGVPVLAICRGLQLLNVALGGTLVQDIPTEVRTHIDHDRSAQRHERVHGIDTEPGSRLAAALGATSLAVNSSHHQSIDRIAAPLAVVARAPDGIIEAAETLDAGWWAVGVQWHPEGLVGTAGSWDRDLFAAFATQARCRADRASPVPLRTRRAAS